MLTRRAMLGSTAAAAGLGIAGRGLALGTPAEVHAPDLGLVPGEDAGVALNRAIQALADQGGGLLRLEPGVYGVRQPVILLPGVTLSGGGETTIRAMAPIGSRAAPRSLIEQPVGASGCGLEGLVLDCAGQVSFAAWRAMAPRQTRCAGVTLLGWTFGLHFTSTRDEGCDGVVIESTTIRSGAARQIYPVFLSSTVGGQPFRNLAIDGLEIIGSGGSYSPENAATADQLTLQNVHGFAIRNVISREAGENGISIVRGCRDGAMSAIEVTGSDGQGCQIGGGGLVVTVQEPSAFQPGMAVLGAASGAGAVVDRVTGNAIWLSGLKHRQFEPDELLRGPGGASRIVDAGFCRNIAIDGLRARDNGLNRAGIRGAFADLYLTHAEAIVLRNADLASTAAWGLLVNNSRSVPCELSAADGNRGTVRRTGRTICL